MNNIDRMFEEISRRAGASVAPGVASEFADLLMRIVDSEDKHRLGRLGAINREVEELIRSFTTTARAGSPVAVHENTEANGGGGEEKEGEDGA